MQRNYVTYKFKAAVLLCLCIFANLLTAQNTSNYKYVITPFDFDTVSTSNHNVLEINNRYYVLTAGFNGDRASSRYISDYQDIEEIGVVTVFDEGLSPIEQFQLFADGIILFPLCFFYEEDTFYVFGWYRLPNHYPPYENCFAKFDKNFNLVQPVTTFWYPSIDSNGGYDMQVLRTKKKEFIIQLEDIMERNTRLVHINSKGEILQDILLQDLPIGAVSIGSILETDSNYILCSWYSDMLCLLNKDSLNIYRFVKAESGRGAPDGRDIIINNQIIRSCDYATGHEECPKDQFGFPVSEDDRSIVIFDDTFAIKHHLEFGEHCVYDGRGMMDYINPDSIYYAYETYAAVYPDYMFNGGTISIANFSLDGKLNFNYTLDLPIDSGIFRSILFCKALSNGGVLIGGDEGDYFGFYEKGFLLYHHPTKTVNNVKEHATNTNTERKVYPNPTRGKFTITNTENAEIQLYNIVGQKVLHTDSKEENTVINVDFLPRGMYVLKVTKDRNLSVHKIQLVE
jgi:hypothetical protein